MGFLFVIMFMLIVSTCVQASKIKSVPPCKSHLWIIRENKMLCSTCLKVAGGR
jgi:hypothetical protein